MDSRPVVGCVRKYFAVARILASCCVGLIAPACEDGDDAQPEPTTLDGSAPMDESEQLAEQAQPASHHDAGAGEGELERPDAGADHTAPPAEVVDAGSERDAGARTTTAPEADADGGVEQPPSVEEPPTVGPETPGLDLGGMRVRKEDVIAVIHFGHSNMSGNGTDPEELRPYFFTETHPRVWMYRLGTPPVLALEPTARVMRDGRAGPGLALLKQAAEMAPNKYFLSLGYGHGGASCIHFTPGWPYWDELIKSAVDVKDSVTFAAIVVMLGVVESQSTPEMDTTRSLPDCYVQLAKAVREAVGQPELPMLFSGHEVEGTGTFAGDQDGPQRAMMELAKVPSLVPNSALVPADGVAMQDTHHFNLAGHMLWTRRVLDIMQARGWFPWAEMTTGADP